MIGFYAAQMRGAPAGAGFAFVGSSTDSSNGGLSLTAARPTGVAAGDMLLAVFFAANQNRTFVTPAGWTKVMDDGPTGNRVATFLRIAGSSEPSSYTFELEGTTTTQLSLGVAAFRGPVQVQAIGAVNRSGTHVAPSVSGEGVALLVGVFANENSSALTVSAAPPGMLQAFLQSGASRNLAAFYALSQPGGASGDREIVWGSSSTTPASANFLMRFN